MSRHGAKGQIVTLNDLASIGSFVSGFAVVISLIYLGLQIRQNTKHSQALIQQGRAARIADTSLRSAELRADEAIDRCFNGSTDVSAKDVARFLFICRAIFISAEDSYYHHQEGLMDGATYESFVTSLRTGLGAPGIAAAWKMTRDMYESQFRDFMDCTAGDVTGRYSARGLENWKKAVAEVTAAAQPAAG